MKTIWLIILFSLMTSLCYARECAIQSIVYDENKQEYKQVTKIITFFYFNTKIEAEQFAKYKGWQNNIITEQTGGYYVFSSLEKEFFVCEFTTKEKVK